MIDTNPAISENIRRLLMFKTLKKIKAEIDKENKYNQKSKRLTLTVIAIVAAMLCILLLADIIQHKKQPTRVLGFYQQPVTEIISGKA